ncbi:MAG TPA: hypothetical protein PLV25_02330, partial [Opitutales bacterium]|nr:hypothetical protein [Opitutales bacterium]
IQALIAAGADVNVLDTKGCSALCCAVDYNKLDAFKALVAAGADLYPVKRLVGVRLMRYLSAKQPGWDEMIKLVEASGIARREDL